MLLVDCDRGSAVAAFGMFRLVDYDSLNIWGNYPVQQCGFMANLQGGTDSGSTINAPMQQAEYWIDWAKLGDAQKC